MEENRSIEGIAKGLNSEGSLTRDGSLWKYGNVRDILTHPGYRREHQYGINMPPLVDGALWQCAKERREEPRKPTPRPQAKAWCSVANVGSG
jgi:hypothetical protein